MLAAGDDASCTITNTFIPAAQPAHLTLAKALDNTGGGTAHATDWTLTASGPTSITGHTGDAAITNAAVGAGTYMLAEAGPAGYSPGIWSCSAGTLTGTSLVLAAGDDAQLHHHQHHLTIASRPIGLHRPDQHDLPAVCEPHGADPAWDQLRCLWRDDPPEHQSWRVLLLQLGNRVGRYDPITTSQHTTNSSGALFALNQGHAFIWNANGNKVGNMVTIWGEWGDRFVHLYDRRHLHPPVCSTKPSPSLARWLQVPPTRRTRSTLRSMASNSCLTPRRSA